MGTVTVLDMGDLKVRHFVVEYTVTWEPVTFNL